MTTYQRGAEIDWSHHPVDFSNRLTVRVDAAGVDAAALKDEFGTGGYDHLSLRIHRAATVPDLSFLEEINDIRELDVVGRVEDDTYAFHRPDVRRLVLLTRCRRRIPAIDLRHLEGLTLDTRPGHEQIHDLPGLRQLALFGWTSQDLTFLGHMPQLEALRLEARKILLSLSGVEGCPGLRDVWLEQARVGSLEPLRGLQLARLWILGGKGMTQEVLLDLADLTGMTGLHDLRIIRGGAVSSARPLLRLPNLRWARLDDTRIRDRDSEPIRMLRDRGVRV